MKQYCSFLFFLLMVVPALAQKRGSIKGTVADTVTKQSIAGATVTVMRKADSSLMSFTLTDDAGQFRITGIPAGQYRVLISHINYHNTVIYFTMDQLVKEMDLGKVIMHDKATVLEEVVVKAEAPPVTMIGDTIQYHAPSFKVPPNGSVEQLLKKLPGIEVSKDGTITAQGKKVQRVLVDGREFFGNDPKIATKNLTADIVEKVQVYDALSEQASLTGFEDDNSIKTINLKLKADKKKGMFGKLMAGGGTSDRYTSRMNVNSFKGVRQLSLIAVANNINDEASSLPSGEGGRVVVNNMPGMANGINSTGAGGLNYNNIIGTKTDLTSNYFFTRTDRNNQTNTVRQYWLPDSTYHYKELAASKELSNLHRVNLGLDYYIDSFHSIKIKPSFEFGDGRQRAQKDYAQTGEDGLAGSGGRSNSLKGHQQFNFSNTLIFRKKFRLRGRTFFMSLVTLLGRDDAKGNLESINRFYDKLGQPVNTGRDSILQRNTTNDHSFNYIFRAAYTEPIFRRTLLEVNVDRRREQKSLDVRTWDLNKASGEYDLPRLDQTSDYENINSITSVGVKVHHRYNKLSVSLGAGWQRSELKGTIIAGTKDSVIGKTFLNILPNARIQYNFSKTKYLSLSYSPATTLPTASQLQPVADLSRLPEIRRGNPDLKQEYNNNLQLSYHNVSMFRGKTLFAFLSFGETRNSIVDYDSVDNLGVRHSQPVNVNGIYRLASNISVSFPLRSIYSTLRLGLHTRYNQGKQFVNTLESSTNTIGMGPTIAVDISISEDANFSCSGNLNFTNTKNSLHPDTSTKIIMQTYEASFDWQLPASFYFSTDMSYMVNAQSGGEPGIRLMVWNASLGWQFLNNKRGELKLIVNDILNQNTGINRAAMLNFIEDRRTMTLRRYGILTFTYNLSKARS